MATVSYWDVGWVESDPLEFGDTQDFVLSGASYADVVDVSAYAIGPGSPTLTVLNKRIQGTAFSFRIENIEPDSVIDGVNLAFSFISA